MGFRNASQMPSQSDQLLELLKQATSPQQQQMREPATGNAQGVPAGQGMAAPKPQVYTMSGMNFSKSPEEAELERRLKQSIEGQQAKMSTSNTEYDKMYQKALADSKNDTSASKAMWLYLAGDTPEQIQAQIANETPAAKQKNLQEILKQKLEGENKLGDNQTTYLKDLLSDKTTQNYMKAQMGNAGMQDRNFRAAAKYFDLGSKAQSTPLGGAMSVIDSSNKIGKLVESNGFNLNPQMTNETMLSLATMLSRGHLTNEIYNSVNPKFSGKTYAEMYQYATNHPKEAESQHFIANAMHTIIRERDAAQQTAANYLAQGKSGYAGTDPRIDAMIQQVEQNIGRPLSVKEVTDFKKLGDQADQITHGNSGGGGWRPL